MVALLVSVLPAFTADSLCWVCGGLLLCAHCVVTPCGYLRAIGYQSFWGDAYYSWQTPQNSDVL